MIYSEKGLNSLYGSCEAIHVKCNTLVKSYVTRDFKADQAREYATHGFCRRLQILAHCIERVFETLPPNTVQPPETYEQIDATVYLQAFVFNVFGCVDNLAHIWVREQGLTNKKGNPFPNPEVGFGEQNKRVLDSLSSDFRDYLVKLKPWFENLENFRNALAHRIPLYIPPYIVPEDKLLEYNKIEARIDEAVEREDDYKIGQLGDKQKALMSFAPIATHSFDENAPKICFHAQMIADFNTVEEIAQKLLKEFDR